MIPRRELLAVVSEDLRYLREEWNETVDDPSLRRGSTVLRRLLVQGELQRAWRAAGFPQQPRITASTLRPILDQIPVEKIAFAAAGGAHFNGAELRGLFRVNYLMARGESKAIYEKGRPSDTTTLGAFIEAPSIVVSGHLVPRRLLVKYVANKLGGAHYDSKRAPDERIFSLLDQVRTQLKLLDKPAIYFELLSMGQAVARAEDLDSFLMNVGSGDAA